MCGKTLITNSAQMYSLVEQENNQLILNVMCGGIAMFEARVPLTSAEVSLFEKEGDAYLERLAIEVRKNVHSYESRMI